MVSIFKQEKDHREKFFNRTHEILYDIEKKYVKQLSEDGAFMTEFKPKELQSVHKDLKEKCDKIDEMVKNGKEDEVFLTCY